MTRHSRRAPSIHAAARLFAMRGVTNRNASVSRRRRSRRPDALNTCVSITLPVGSSCAVNCKAVRVAASILLLSGVAALNAATLERLTIEQMAQQATAVVRGRVGEARAARFGALVYTLHRFDAEERFKGAPIAGLEVAVLGGTYEGVNYSFAGTPDLKAGDEYVLFLWTGPSGRTQIVGLSQGVFRVVRSSDGAVVMRTDAKESVFAGEDGPPRSQALEMTFDQLAASVRAALETNPR